MAFYQTERCFRRYEKIIATALNKYPESVRFKSPNRLTSTDAARCADAVASYRRNQWPTSDGIFALIEERPLKVWIERDCCVIGGNVERNAEVQIVDGIGEGVHGALKANPVNSEQVRMLITLLDQGVLTNPIEIPKSWHDFVISEVAGLMNIAYRIEPTSIILF